MNHETEEILTALLDGQLTAEQESELRARLESEAGLRELFERLQAQRQLLRSLPRVQAPEDFLGRVAVALKERAFELTPALTEIEESGPRGGWRTVAMLASGLAAVLLIGVFLWPRELAQKSDRVAGFEGTDRAKQLQVEELQRLEKGDWIDSAPTQRAPSGPLPKAAEAADGSITKSEAAPQGSAAAALEADDIQPRAKLGENLQAKAAPADELLNADAERVPGRDAGGVDSAGKASAEIAGLPQKMSEFRGNDAPVLGAASSQAGGLGAFGAADSQIAPIEVWVVNEVELADPSNEQEKKQDASQVDLYFAAVSEDQLPDWLSEVQATAEITRLDLNESRELLMQLAERRQEAVEKGAGRKPGAAADAVLDSPSDSGGRIAAGAAAAERKDLAAQFGYLGRKEGAALNALLSRSQQRQLAVEESATRGLGGGGGGAARRSANGEAKAADKSVLKNNLSNLRTLTAEPQAFPQPLPPSSGRNVLIIIRSR